MSDPHVKVDFSPLERIVAAVEGASATGDRGPVSRGFKVWAQIYRAFLRDRFDRFSKGGGTWPYLSKATLAARRRKVKGWKLKRGQTWKKKRFKKGTAISVGQRPKILRDTGTLFAALQAEFIRAPGQLEKRVPFGVRVGYGGTGKYKKGKSKAAVADIASFHQAGGGNLPQRKIIVNPDDKTLDRMAEVMIKMMGRARDGS